MSKGTVSVVIPTHNRCSVLQRTLTTVLAQEGVAVQVLVVDDGSTDGTPQRLRAVRDPRVTVVRHEQARGVSAARNAGLAHATCEWVAFTDDDDLWAPDKLSAQLGAARQCPGTGWVAVGEVLVNPALAIIGGRKPPQVQQLSEVLRYNLVPAGGSGTMARTSLVRDLGGFDNDLSVLADWDLWIRLFLTAPAAVVRRPLVAYLVHPTSMSHDTSRVERELEIVISKYADDRIHHDVTFLHTVWLQWIARMQIQGHDRAAAARTAVRMLRYWRELPSFTGAAVRGLPRRWRLAGWRSEAERWLAPLRDTDVPSDCTPTSPLPN